jgi:Zn-dependent protease
VEVGVTVFRVGGIPVRLHVTLLLVVGWVAVTVARHGTQIAVPLLVPLAILYASVLLHELGHALVARRHDVGTRAITLHVLGGAAQLETRQVPAEVDAIVSLAGPATNLAIAAVSLVVALFWPARTVLTVGAVNLLLGVLNLLPAFPLDGGRILRAVLVPRLGLARANRIALSVGFAFAVATGVAGVALRQPWLVPMAGFMALLQRREQRVQSILRQHPDLA